jgi:two-component system, sensor histidine kinase YesM
MSENLSKYYRYTTRQERDFVRLSEELDFVTNYLEIQRMRRNSLEYEIDIPARMKKQDIPPLVLQPLVENAVLHGIEASNKAGRIRIIGECQEHEMKLIVEDNGIGLGELEREALLEKLRRPMDEEMGCGLWNVHQRMLLRFGENAGLSFGDSGLGGLKVTLTWRLTSDQERDEGGEA